MSFGNRSRRASSGSTSKGTPPATTSAVAKGLSAPAAAAIEIARLDLAAKLAGIPLWRLLGASSVEAVECNATLVAGPPKAVAADAERWLARGFRTLKLKVGVPGDVGQVEAVREAAGPEAGIRVDANGVWSPQEAVLRLTAMERQRIELAEQPAADLEGLAASEARPRSRSPPTRASRPRSMPSARSSWTPASW